MGQARLAATPAGQSALRKRLSHRRDLPGARQGAHAVLLLDRAGWHTTGKLDIPKTLRRSSGLRAPGVEPGREHLAISARQLAVEPRLRNLRCNHRRRLRRLAKTHRPARSHHLNRDA